MGCQQLTYKKSNFLKVVHSKNDKTASKNVLSSYRYAYQGQEKDPETGKEAFELRLWDGRIGRWLTTDPAGQYSSPYIGMGNDPINGIDPDGAFKREWWAKFINILVGGDGVKFNESKNEYYVEKFSTIYEKGRVSYEGVEYDVLHEGTFINHIYKNPEFFIEGSANTSIGNQVGISANLISIGIGGNIFEGRKQLWNKKLGISNKEGVYGSSNENLGGDENGFNIDLVLVNGGATFESKRGLLNWGDYKSEQIGTPIFGQYKQEYDYTNVLNANTIRTRSWGLAGVHFSAIIGFEGSIEFGYKY